MLARHLPPAQGCPRPHPGRRLAGPAPGGQDHPRAGGRPGFDALYLDLESEQDRAKLAQPELYLADHQREIGV